MTIRTQDRKVADAFGRLFPWLGLSGPPYVGSMKGVQGAKELLGIWPTLVRRELVESQDRDRRGESLMRVPLWKIAHARSGDKADRADIGLFAWDAPTYAVLKREVTPERAGGALPRHVPGAGRALAAGQPPRAQDRAQRARCRAARRARCAWTTSARYVAAQLLRMEIEAPADLPRLRSS